MLKTTRTLAAFALAVTPLFAAAQQTVNLTIGASHPETLPWIAAMKNFFVPEVNKRLEAAGGKVKINWREAYGGILYKPNATLTSVSEGIADVGWVFSNLEGARQPLSQVSTFTPGVTADYRLMSAVHNELIDTNPALRGEWEKHNLVYLGAMAVESLHLFTTFPVKSIDDIKGKKISAGGTIGAWVAAMGATPVDGALPSFYNDIKTGISQGAMTIPTGVLGVKLFEVTNNVTLVDMGTFFAGALAMNRDSFNKLPPDAQKIIREVGREYSLKVSENVDRGVAFAFKTFKDQGAKMTVTEFPAAEREQMFRSMRNIATEWAKTNDAKGLPASKVLAEYMDLMRKRGAKPVRDWDK